MLDQNRWHSGQRAYPQFQGSSVNIERSERPIRVITKRQNEMFSLEKVNNTATESKMINSKRLPQGISDFFKQQLKNKFLFYFFFKVETIVLQTLLVLEHIQLDKVKKCCK